MYSLQQKHSESDVSMRRAIDQSYLLRLWADRAGGPLRATLTPVGQPDAHYHFASLDELLAFLETAAQGPPPAEDGDAETAMG